MPRTDFPTDDHLNISQIGMMQRCEFAYLMRYGHGVKSPPAWAQAFGRAFEVGIDAHYEHKLESGENMPEGDVVDRNVGAIVEALEEVLPGDGLKLPETVDAMAKTTRVFHGEIASLVTPLAVQPTFSVELPREGREPIRFVGHPDLVMDSLGGPVLVDNKTTGKSGGWSEADVAASLQPAAYSLGYEMAGNGLIPHFEFHIARWELKREKKTQVLVTPVTPEERAGMKQMLFVAASKKDWILQSGIGLPNYGWQCRGCGYREHCQKEWRRKPPE